MPLMLGRCRRLGRGVRGCRGVRTPTRYQEGIHRSLFLFGVGEAASPRFRAYHSRAVLQVAQNQTRILSGPAGRSVLKGAGDLGVTIPSRSMQRP
jgi:hypothetical protein